jgi:hypothetical protein
MRVARDSESSYFVTSKDYDALAARLAEAEEKIAELKRMLARWHARFAPATADSASGDHS